MAGFARCPEIRVLMEELMEKQVTEKGLEEKIEEVCRIIVRELKERGFTKSDEIFLEIQKEEVRKQAAIRKLEQEEKTWTEKNE